MSPVHYIAVADTGAGRTGRKFRQLCASLRTMSWRTRRLSVERIRSMMMRTWRRVGARRFNALLRDLPLAGQPLAFVANFPAKFASTCSNSVPCQE